MSEKIVPSFHVYRVFRSSFVRIHTYKFQFVVKCFWNGNWSWWPMCMAAAGWHGVTHFISLLTANTSNVVVFSLLVIHFFFSFAFLNYCYAFMCILSHTDHVCVSVCVCAIFPESMLWIYDSKWFIEDTKWHGDGRCIADMDVCLWIVIVCVGVCVCGLRRHQRDNK